MAPGREQGDFTADRRLVRRLLAREEAAFREFFGGYVQRLGAFVLRRSALDVAAVEDVVQNVMIKALHNLAGYRGEASLFTWMCQICRSELADQRRKSQRRAPIDNIDDSVAIRSAVEQLRAASELEPPAQAQFAQESAAVVRALRRLPERYALALEWKYGDELSVEQIGAQFGITTTAAQSLLARSREAFREEWCLEQPMTPSLLSSQGGLSRG
jgi:RNA polymerase sigma-70 factor (ECF subfamily)